MAIPGVNVTVNDGGLRIDPVVSGPRVMLLGTTSSTDLAINEPVVVVDVTRAMNALREDSGAYNDNTRHESELSLALTEALGAGAPLIEVVKIATVTGAIDYTGYASAYRFIALSGAYDALANHPTDVVVPVGAYAEDYIGTGWNNASGIFTGGSYTSESFLRQLGRFCYNQTVNQTTTIGVIGVKPPLLAPVTGASTNYVSTGDNGYLFGTPSLTNIAGWASYVQGAAPTKVSAAWLSYLSGSTLSYNSAYLNPGAFQAIDSSGSGLVDELGNKVDIGAYVNVVAAPVRCTNSASRKLADEMDASLTNVSINTSAAAAYAGLIASLDPHSGTTNKTIPGIIPARKLSLTQADAINAYRIVTMLERTRGFVVVQGHTGAYKVNDYTRSDYTQLTTVRITQAAIDQVRLATEPFIGEALNGANLNAMRQAVDTGLRNMKLAGALNRYDFNILSTPDQQVLGQATVDLTIVPAFELVRVNVSVKLAKQ
jgi:hypothetical protein